MIKIHRGMPAALGLAVILFAPGFARAQVQQLFPNAPIRIRRQRPPCAEEPPYYKFVRQQYYGYFPTCWRKWPTGWQCPCGHPEPPDIERALRERPLQESQAGPLSDDDLNRGLDDNLNRPLDVPREPKNVLPDDDMGPVNPPPPARGGRLNDVPPINPGRRDNPGNPVVPGTPGEPIGPGDPSGGLRGPRASVEDSDSSAASGDEPELPPVSLASDESPGAIDPSPSPETSEAPPQPAVAPPARPIPPRPSVRPAPRRGLIGALIGRIRRG